METVLESRLLDDLPPPLVVAVAEFVRERQGAKMPLSRSGILVSELMEKHSGWLSELDIGRPTGGARKWKPSTMIGPKSPRISPSMLSPGPSPQIYPIGSRGSPSSSPNLLPLREDDEPFAMDDFSLEHGSSTSSKVVGTSGSFKAVKSGSTTRPNSLPQSPYLGATTPTASTSKVSWNSIPSDSSRLVFNSVLLFFEPRANLTIYHCLFFIEHHSI